MKQSPTSLIVIEREIKGRIADEMQRIGIHCHVFSRIKDYDSLQEKVVRKQANNGGKPYYTNGGKMIQDIIGIRIVTYFYEDVQFLWDLFKSRYVVDNVECEEITPDTFKALRKNMVCKMPDNEKRVLSEFKSQLNDDDLYNLVDDTFEIQFRTTLSEGWHEVDHVLRYKLEKDWEGFDDENRMLNGIYATLETSDRALKSLFDELAYKCYRVGNWMAMLRFKFRLHTPTGGVLSAENEHILNENADLAKRVLRCSRSDLLRAICFSGIRVPLTLDNILGTVNFLFLGDESLTKATSPILLRDLRAVMKEYQEISED